ncbi:MAG: Glutamate synthase [NADPH] large chain [Verrucomicrobia subdivision 3 bacterium]|nr:Glutamate synthase [NADPH] large chain [Limisphaerales bacterium]MCS1416225.1 Glutamate synthase [NADPH] large chain [Limisphaerales bacterium]
MYPRISNSLYHSSFEHDACGVGFVANQSGKKEGRILEYGLQALCNLAHRGALDADAKTGDGAGVLIQIPHDFFRMEVDRLGAKLAQDTDLGIAFVFLPKDNGYQISHGQQIMEAACERFGVHCLGWRDVPINPRCLGDKALSTVPEMKQLLMARSRDWDDEEYERRLFLVRKFAGIKAREASITDFYICSCSSRTIVYKGLFNAPQLAKFFSDLASPLFTTASVVFHQRYSTNTFPTWRLAHPYRMMAHNGEINTLLGNKNWTRAREQEITSEVWGENIEVLRQIIQPEISDSAALDNALEILRLSGRSVLHSAMMLMPEAWEKMDNMDPVLRDFYLYHACLNEPWDGPAAVIFNDGRFVGASLDRNGLRPARYTIYEDGLVVMGSEAGLVRLDESKVVRKGRLGPGKIIAVDTEECRFLDNGEVKQIVSNQQPYGKWCAEKMFVLSEHAKPLEPSSRAVNLLDLTLQQITFGWDTEELSVIVKPMVVGGAEAIGSMGDDTPLAVLSKRPKLLYTYFKQLFAQVTNPAIDSIRERIVMSLATSVGHRRSWLEEGEEHAKLIRINSPFLLDYELATLREMNEGEFASEDISCHFSLEGGVADLDSALDRICRQASEAVDAGKAVLILSDKDSSAELVPIPMLLAVGAIHHHLIRERKRLRASIICETGEARDVHQFACLVGFGASAINPYVAIDTVRQWLEDGELDDLTLDKALANYRNAIESGMLKIMAKMGISTISSYRGAQIFEAIGLSEGVMDRCFFGTRSQIGGISLRHIAEDAIRRHQQAYGDPEAAALEDGGNYKVLPGGRGEVHAFNKKVVQRLHKFLHSGQRAAFLEYMKTADERDPVSIRDLFELKPMDPVPIEEVEPLENIRVRFTTAGMSMGALSPEAHECLAIAMNRIGGKSNSGEGGEDAERYNVRENGDNPCSAIKQVASGRFGVTPEYLASAQEIEIKIAQGAKPGEGGQLPGHKVSVMIAKLRHSTPGVPLISPPPHHDIYSIEDLAQLIYDLKQVNPRAKVCVKLVACAGVGTVAAGVAKAYADVVLISGHDGGTGASPQSSIKHTGVPFEFGVAEAQQTLMLNDLRSRVVLRTDGGIKTGLDIVMAAILGAEEFNFGTAALIAAGCAMFRVCHLNTCPVGVATQKEELRLKFRGKAENVMAFFDGVAEEVRELMASLGIRHFDDLVGRTDLLVVKSLDKFPEELRDKISTLKLDKLLYQVDPTGVSPRIHTRERNERFGDSSLDDQIINDAKKALNGKGKVMLSYRVSNGRRNIGTKVSGLIGYTYGDKGLEEGAIDLTLHGSAGQGLATFLAAGIRIKLFGEANDYVAKGMSGGEVIIRPPENCGFAWSENIIIGNTVMYGATGGRLFAAGKAGERFCVRNSGGTAVVEGVGDHGCEYMTGGIVVILGSTGRNFGAGMSGGTAYVYDVNDTFPNCYNSSMVNLERLDDNEEINRLQGLIFAHLEATESLRASKILKDWEGAMVKFWRVVPEPPAAKPASKPVHELSKEKPEAPPEGSF